MAEEHEVLESMKLGPEERARLCEIEDDVASMEPDHVPLLIFKYERALAAMRTRAEKAEARVEELVTLVTPAVRHMIKDWW